MTNGQPARCQPVPLITPPAPACTELNVHHRMSTARMHRPHEGPRDRARARGTAKKGTVPTPPGRTPSPADRMTSHRDKQAGTLPMQHHQASRRVRNSNTGRFCISHTRTSVPVGGPPATPAPRPQGGSRPQQPYRKQLSEAIESGDDPSASRSPLSPSELHWFGPSPRRM
jgi:hypothetical protein